MRVLCVKILDPMTGEKRDRDAWMTVDREYTVLAIYVEPGGEVRLRIESDNYRTPALFPAEMFMTLSTLIPRSWRARLDEGGSLEIAPEPWLRPGFWEDFFDQVPAAVDAFEKERELILSEEEIRRD